MSVDVAWYVARLMHMSSGEIVHRVRERFQLRSLERSQPLLLERRLRPRHELISFCTARTSVLPRLTWDRNANCARATELLEGRWPALGFGWYWAPTGNVWHRAPDTGSDWPRQYFTKIAYRQGNPYGDARVVWEPSRLQQLVSLALLCDQTQYRAQAVGLIERQLVSWTRANPPFVGIHYVSAMECALRLIAVCHAVDMIRQWIAHPRATWSAVLLIVTSHARLIERRLSLHSSAANHTVAEAAGLVYAGVLFPEIAGSKRWREQGTALLQLEVPRQILPDGGGAEQAPAYLKQIADLATLARLLDAGLAPIARRITLARRFLAECRGDTNHLTGFGDDDGGHALSRFWRPAASTAASARLRATFPDTGYTILRSRSPLRHQIGFRHGSLGLPPLHGHGHADALSITWRNHNRELLIDPGTFTYTGNPAWRRYFRGTSAHNTVTIDGLDQSNQRGAFIWHPTISGQLARTGNWGHSVLLATHNGFPALRVRHWRGLVYGHGNRLVVWDYITGEGEHTVSAWWHLGDDADIEESSIRSQRGGSSMAITGAGEVHRHRGSIEPIAGWRSSSYGRKAPNTCIEARYSGTLPHAFTTVIVAHSDESLEIDEAEHLHLSTLHDWARSADPSKQAQAFSHTKALW
jgi:hypothetical protein